MRTGARPVHRTVPQAHLCPGGAAGLIRVRRKAASASASGCVRRGEAAFAGLPGRFGCRPCAGRGQPCPRARRSGVAAFGGASGACRPRAGAAASAGLPVRRGGRPRPRAGKQSTCLRPRFGVLRPSSVHRDGGRRWSAGVVRSSSVRGARPPSLVCAERRLALVFRGTRYSSMCRGGSVLLRARGSGPRRRFRETRSSSIAGAAAFAGVLGRFGASPRAGKRPAPVLQGNAVLAHVSGRRPRRFAGAVRCSSMSGLARDGQASFVTSEDGGSALPGRERTSSVHS